MVPLLLALPAFAADPPVVNRAMLGMFQPLPEVVENPDNPFNEAKIDLGRRPLLWLWTGKLVDALGFWVWSWRP